MAACHEPGLRWACRAAGRLWYPFDEGYGGECPGVYYLRLQRDGWKLLRGESPSSGESVTVFEKPLPKGWVLEKSAHATIDSPVGYGCYYDTHRLLHPENGTTLDYPEWEWAQLDRKRLVWVSKGVLYAAKIHGNPQRIRSTRPSARTTTPGSDLRTSSDASLAAASLTC
jgi:hypothetical protein